MAGNNSTTYSSLLKQHYNAKKLANYTAMKSRFLGMMGSKTDVDGELFVHPMTLSAGQGYSPTYADAAANAALTGDVHVAFHVPLYEDQRIASVSTKIIKQTKGTSGSFLKAVTPITDNAMKDFVNKKAHNAYRSRSGSLGTISTSTTIASSSLTFTNLKDALAIPIGAHLDLAANETTGAVKAYGSAQHGLYVKAINQKTGTLTIAVQPNKDAATCFINDATHGIPTAAQGDHVFYKGSRNLIMHGFADWIPYTDPTAGDTFLNVDRSISRYHLAGIPIDGTQGQLLTDVLEDALGQMGEIGSEPTHAFMSYKKFTDLSKLLGSKNTVNVKINAEVGFSGIKIVGSTGDVICVPDRMCPSTTIALVNIETWKKLSVDPMIHLWEVDGNVWFPSSTEMGQEMRYYSFSNIMCEEPLHNAHIRVVA